MGDRMVFKLSATRRMTYTVVAAAAGSSLIWNQGALRSRPALPVLRGTEGPVPLVPSKAEGNGSEGRVANV